MNDEQTLTPKTAADESDSPESDPDLVAVSQAVEAILMVATEPAPESVLAVVLGQTDDTIRHVCVGLADAYADSDRGFQLVRVAGGWRYQSHPEQAEWVTKMVLEGQTARLSAAATETLAIIAYKQPVSRVQVAAIRGVNADGVIKTLTQRGYVEEVGRDEGPGQAILLGTTSEFLEKVGLGSLQDLPSLGDFVPPAHIVEALEQTLMVSDADGMVSDTEGMVSDADGMVSDTVEPIDIDLTAPEHNPAPAPVIE